MKHVQRRLGVTDTAKVTQGIETDIIDTLKEMIEALKKKIQENKSQPKPGEGLAAAEPGPEASRQDRGAENDPLDASSH